MFENLWFGNREGFPGLPNFLAGASGQAPMPIHHLVAGEAPDAVPYKPEVMIVASNDGFHFKCPAGGQKLYAGLGADKARKELGIKVALSTGASAGSLQAVIQTNDHVDPEEAASVLHELLQELLTLDKGATMIANSFTPADALQFFLSGFTSVSPKYCYKRIIDRLGLKWNSRVRIVACAVEIDPANPLSLNPYGLTNYRHWPLVITEDSGIPLEAALEMSGLVPGMFTPPYIGKSERGYPVIAVDGAFINRIPNLPGDLPSIAMSYTRATKLPREVTDELPSEWAALWNPLNMFDSKYLERVTSFWKKALRVYNPVAMYGLMQHSIEIHHQICGNSNRQMPGDFPIVLGLDDFAALNLGATDEARVRMFKHGYEEGMRRFKEGLESGQLVIPS